MCESPLLSPVRSGLISSSPPPPQTTTTTHTKTNSHDDADDLALRLYARAALQSEEHYYALGSLMLRMEAKGLDTTDGARYVGACVLVC